MTSTNCKIYDLLKDIDGSTNLNYKNSQHCTDLVTVQLRTWLLSLHTLIRWFSLSITRVTAARCTLKVCSTCGPEQGKELESWSFHNQGMDSKVGNKKVRSSNFFIECLSDSSFSSSSFFLRFTTGSKLVDCKTIIV